MYRIVLLLCVCFMVVAGCKPGTYDLNGTLITIETPPAPAVPNGVPLAEIWVDGKPFSVEPVSITTTPDDSQAKVWVEGTVIWISITQPVSEIKIKVKNLPALAEIHPKNFYPEGGSVYRLGDCLRFDSCKIIGVSGGGNLAPPASDQGVRKIEKDGQVIWLTQPQPTKLRLPTEWGALRK